MPVFDASSTSNPTDSRQAATDNAKAIRGRGNKYLDTGSVDLSKARISQGNVTLKGVKGNITFGDNGEGIAQVSSIFANIIDSLLNSSGSAVVSGPSIGVDVGGLLSGAPSNSGHDGTADNVSITDAAWWTTPRKIVAAAVAGLLLLLILFKR